MAKFTDTWVKNLKPSKKRVEYRSDGNTGFTLVTRGPTKTWHYIFTVLKKKHIMTLGTYPSMSLADAKSAYAEAASLKKSGINPAEKAQSEKLTRRQATLTSREEVTTSELVDEYLENYAKKKKRSWKEDERVLRRHIEPAIGKLKIKTVTRRHIKPIIKALQNAEKDSMARIVLAITRKMFAYAIEEDIDDIEINPCMNIKVEASKSRERSLSATEIKMLWYGLDKVKICDSIKRLIRLNFLTASRHGELRGLRWNEIHGDYATIPAERMKGMNGKVKPHNIPLTKLALEIIGKPNGCEYVFPSPKKTGKPLGKESTGHALKRILPIIKSEEFPNVILSNIRLHDIRSTVNDWMAQIGIRMYDRDRVLAHIDGSVNAKNYTVYEFDKEKRAALEKWERKLKEILGMESASNIITLAR